MNWKVSSSTSDAGSRETVKAGCCDLPGLRRLQVFASQKDWHGADAAASGWDALTCYWPYTRKLAGESDAHSCYMAVLDCTKSKTPVLARPNDLCSGARCRDMPKQGKTRYQNSPIFPTKRTGQSFIPSASSSDTPHRKSSSSRHVMAAHEPAQFRTCRCLVDLERRGLR